MRFLRVDAPVVIRHVHLHDFLDEGPAEQQLDHVQPRGQVVAGPLASRLGRRLLDAFDDADVDPPILQCRSSRSRPELGELGFGRDGLELALVVRA